jgi:YgiT-type zinc finger domain-containing protein
MQDETCEYCNGEVREKTVTVHYRHKGKLVVIENVPARVCWRCGERYYDAATVERMEAIARRKKPAEKEGGVPDGNSPGPPGEQGNGRHALLSDRRQLRREFWGQHLWARGYFVCSSGNVTDEMIAEYIRNQDAEPQDDQQFKISE